MTVPVPPMVDPDVELLDRDADYVEEMLIAYLAPVYRTGLERKTGDPLPFVHVIHLTGIEDIEQGTADPIVQVDVLCSKALGWPAAKGAANRVHRRMLQLGRYHDAITLPDGREVGPDFVGVEESPKWLDYADVTILRKTGRYRIGLGYEPSSA